jgi:hypothetical protein
MKEQPQPHYDFEIAKICDWLKKNGYTAHVTLNGQVTLRDKQTNTLVKKL